MERQNTHIYLISIHLFILCFKPIESGGLFGFYTQTTSYLKEPKYSLVGTCHDNIITFVGGFTSAYETLYCLHLPLEPHLVHQLTYFLSMEQLGPQFQQISRYRLQEELQQVFVIDNQVIVN